MIDKQSSARMSSLAGRMARITAREIENAVERHKTESLAADIRSLAASVLSQDETPGQQHDG